MPKVLIATGDAAESLEVMYPYQRLLEAGYEVHIAAPARKKLDADRPVAHLCHGALALAPMGVLQGRRSAAYPALEPDVRAAGAEFVDGAGVVDGVMVTARAWPDHPSWMREFVRLLSERAPVEGAREPAGVA